VLYGTILIASLISCSLRAMIFFRMSGVFVMSQYFNELFDL
jgi:Fe2+ transport system protein B